MKKRGLILGLLVMLAVITSGFTYAWWSSQVRTQDALGNDVTIGEAKTATFSVALPSETTGALVPVGQVGNSLSGAVEYVLFQFTVTWEDNFYTSGTLVVTESGVVIDDVSYPGLINFAYQIGGTVNATATTAATVFTGGGNTSIDQGTPVTVYVLVTMDEPANQTEYEAVIDGIIEFDLDFTVESLVE